MPDENNNMIKNLTIVLIANGKGKCGGSGGGGLIITANKNEIKKIIKKDAIIDNK